MGSAFEAQTAAAGMAPLGVESKLLMIGWTLRQVGMEKLTCSSPAPEQAIGSCMFRPTQDFKEI